MSNLLPGENLVLKEHQHWIFLAKALWVPIVVVVLVLVADFTIIRDGNSSLRAILPLGVIALALLWLIVVWIRWRSTTYTLTDQRIKIETGVFGRQEKVIPIDRVQDCTTRTSVVGRMLGYGRVEIDSAGAQGAAILDHLPNPGAFRDQVFMQSERRRSPAASPAMPANPSGV